jgi:twitching motility two-component system response regulator PilH
MNKPGPEAVTRAVVASVSRMEGSVMDQLLAIRNDICTPQRTRVRSAFLYTSGWFIVWVEGDDEAVDEALKIAADDKRNEHQKILHRSRGPATLQERVIVATTQTPMRPTQFARWVMHMKHEGPQLEPQEIWNRLGAPCIIDSSRRPCTRPAQQFALVAADDHGPVDQLRKIGERFASPVIYQRFGLARSHSPDLGMAYVDVPAAAGAARVRVLTRRALAQASVRRSMPPVQAIVLLVGSRPAPAIELASCVADAVKNAATPPQVWLVGPPGEPTDACARLLERCGVLPRIGPPEIAGRIDLSTLLPVIGLQPRSSAPEARAALKALIVDDAVAERERLAGILGRAGYEVVLAESGDEGVARARAERPDVILMDVDMPDLDGFSATRQLKADAQTSGIPVVFVTGRNQRTDVAWGKMLGAKGFVVKPYRDAQVLEQLAA